MYKKEYMRWKNFNELSVELKNELNEMTETELLEAFSSNLEFGTGGLRGIMGPGTNRVNIYTIRKVTLGFANYLINTEQTNGVAISYDNRKNSKLFAYEAAKVLTSNNIKVYLFDDLRPTPMLSYAVRHFNLSGGIMVTASHNPKEYNGYKAYNKFGGQLTLKEADEAISYINKVDDIFKEFNMNEELLITIGADFDDLYLKDVKRISLLNTSKKITILYSPLHGTGGTIIPKLLKDEGYNIEVVEEQMAPDPNFTNAKSSNPEERLAFDNALTYIDKINPDIILLTDPDADRLGTIVKHNNDYEMLNGNQIAVIMINYILEHTKLKEQGYVYKTIVTTNLIDAIVKKYKNVNLIETLTGFKFIANEAEKINGKAKFLFGCEESYGYLISDFVRDKDAVQAAYLLTEIQSYLSDRKMSMIDYLNNIYKEHGYFYEHTESITLKGLDGQTRIKNIMAYFRENGLKLKGFTVIKSEDYLNQIKNVNGLESKLEFDVADVLKYYNESNEWIVFRPSGTEPKIKIYFSVYDMDLASAKSKASYLLNSLIRVIDNV